MISKETFRFLTDLKKNNSRDWFHANKNRYKKAFSEFENLVEFALNKLSSLNPKFKEVKAKDCIFRINKDVRFAKDKTPYNPFFRASLTPSGKKSLDAGFYLHVEPKNMTVIGGGLYSPDNTTITKIRKNIIKSGSDLLKILNENNFKKIFKNLFDDQLKTYPRGFSKEDANSDLIKYKSYICIHTYLDDFVLSKDFKIDFINQYKILDPFISWLNQAKG